MNMMKQKTGASAVLTPHCQVLVGPSYTVSGWIICHRFSYKETQSDKNTEKSTKQVISTDRMRIKGDSRKRKKEQCALKKVQKE